MQLFAAHLYKEHYNYLNVGDTAFAFFDLKGEEPEFFAEMMADTAGGLEKVEGLAMNTLVSKLDENGKVIEYKPMARKVDSAVADDFHRLKAIFSAADTPKHYVIVYRKSFLGL